MIRLMRLITQKAKKAYKKIFVLSVVVVMVTIVFGWPPGGLASAYAPSSVSMSASYRVPNQPFKVKKRHKRHHNRFTGYVVAGGVSTFGYLTGDSEGSTAYKCSKEGCNTARPCIATRSDATLGHYFELSIYVNSSWKAQHNREYIGHPARLIQCDWGPASWTGRSIDITGEGDYALGISPKNFPTSPPGGAWGVAKELR